LTNGKPHSSILYFSANNNGEAEVITVHLRAIGKIQKLKWDVDFSSIDIKIRTAKGITVTKNSVKKIELKEAGVSTLKPRKIWYDETVMRLNVDERGELLGEFKPNDRLLIINQHGNLKTVIPDLSMHFENDIVILEKWLPNKPITVVYFDGERERYYLKRFIIENPNKLEVIISEHAKSQLEIVVTDYRPVLEVIPTKKDAKTITINADEFMEVKGINALGNLVTKDKIKQVNALEPLPYEEPILEEIEVDEEIIEIDSSSILENIDSDDDSEPNIDDSGQISLF
jgi:topoisomerase-4 subunit A